MENGQGARKKRSRSFAIGPGASLLACLALSVLLLGEGSCSSSKPAPQTAPTPPAAPAAQATPVPVRPETLAGDWLFETTRGGNSIQYSLHFSLTSGILAGSLTGPDGNAQELTKIALKSDKVSWDIQNDSGSLHYDGTVSGTSMKGTIRRSRGQSGQGGSSEGSGGSSGRWAGGGMRGRGGRGRGGSSGNSQMTWSAYKSVAPPPGEQSAPAPTPSPSGPPA